MTQEQMVELQRIRSLYERGHISKAEAERRIRALGLEP